MDRTLKSLVDSANATAKTLGLKYRPAVIRNLGTARSIACQTKASVVMLGDGAFWVVCLADAARLEKAGFEWAGR
jgi:hypothetical protein